MDKIYNILFVNNKLNKKGLNINWYIKKNIVDIYNKIFIDTKFLDNYNCTLRERIFYLQKNFKTPQLCKYCNQNTLKFNKTRVNFDKTCGGLQCQTKHRSYTTTTKWNNLSDEQKKAHGLKTSENNKGRKFSKESIAKQQHTRKLNGYKQSSETKQKRIETRINNGKPWHTKETLLKISKSNKITHSSKEFQEKNKESRIEASKKISLTMKQKIKDGLFTPPITNSWTKWNSYININNNIIKFRSNWEALFYLHNTKLLFEKTRLHYKIDNTLKIYIIDFTDPVNKILYEVKPKSTQNNKINESKFKAALEWCENNNYKFEIIDEIWFKNNYNKINLLNNEHLLKTLENIIK